jgi:hypothetical protein
LNLKMVAAKGERGLQSALRSFKHSQVEPI